MKNRKTTLLDKLRSVEIEMITTEILIDLNQENLWGYSEKYLRPFLRNSTGDNNSKYRICTNYLDNNMYQLHYK